MASRQHARYCRCGTRLARDNRGQLCGRCQQQARATLAEAPEVPPEFWQTDQLRDALDSWHMGRVIQAYRQHPWHGQPLSQGVVASWAHMTQTQLSRLENGPALKDLDKLTQWARILRIPAELLWFKIAPHQREMAASEERINSGILSTPRPDGNEFEPAELVDAASAALDDPRRVTTVTVAALRLQLQRAQFEYDLAPSAGLLAATSQQHGYVTYLRDKVSAARLRRELWGLEVESATFMGQLLWDASQRRDHATPRRYFDQAVEAARRIGDTAGAAYATLRKSYLSLYGERNAGDGRYWAQTAAELGQSSSQAMTGLALLHVAEAEAMLGEPWACEHALEQARVRLDCFDDADVAAEYLTPAEIERMSGSCYLFLDQPGRAEPILSRAADELASKQKSQAIVLGNLTLAYTRQRELEAATANLHRAIDALESTRGGGGLNLAFEAGQELRPWRRETAVQELYDRLFSLMVPV